MVKYWLPLVIVVLSSVGYQVGLKEVSNGMDPIVALVVTYLSSSVTSFLLYFILASKEENRWQAVTQVNPETYYPSAGRCFDLYGRNFCYCYGVI